MWGETCSARRTIARPPMPAVPVRRIAWAVPNCHASKASPARVPPMITIVRDQRKGRLRPLWSPSHPRGRAANAASRGDAEQEAHLALGEPETGAGERERRRRLGLGKALYDPGCPDDEHDSAIARGEPVHREQRAQNASQPRCHESRVEGHACDHPHTSAKSPGNQSVRQRRLRRLHPPDPDRVRGGHHLVRLPLRAAASSRLSVDDVGLLGEPIRGGRCLHGSDDPGHPPLHRGLHRRVRRAGGHRHRSSHVAGPEPDHIHQTGRADCDRLRGAHGGHGGVRSRATRHASGEIAGSTSGPAGSGHGVPRSWGWRSASPGRHASAPSSP